MTTTTAPAVPRHPRFTRANLVGLRIAIFLGIADVVAIFVIPAPDAGDDGPPLGVQVLGVLLGLLTIGLAVRGWQTGSRALVRATAGLRIFSAITGLPAFFVDIDAWVKVATAVFTLITIACVVLMLRPAESRAAVTD